MMLYLAAQRPDLDDAIELIGAAQEVAPAAVADLFAHPWLGVWAAQSIRAPSAPGERLHLRNVALAAAARAGLSTLGLAVTPVGQKIVVPSLGMLECGTDVAVWIAPSQLAGPQWHPVRRVAAQHRGMRIDVAIEDLDPYRACHGPPVAERLPAARIEAVQQTLTEAWRLLVEHAPGRAAELAAGLSSLVPLAANDRRAMLSATHREGFGGYAMSLHSEPSQFAATMVHEFQHSKLSALHGLVPLYDQQQQQRYFAPWRPDPRPLGAMLQGVYAFTSVAGLWQALRAERRLQSAATRQFAGIRAQVWRALEQLDGVSGLTPAGRRLVAGLSETMTDLMRHDVPATVLADADAGVRTAERAWGERNP